MKQPIYSIRDMLVEFHAPLVGVNDQQMIRDFGQYCLNKGELERNDLQLYKIGEFDTITGHIISSEPEFLKGGNEYGNNKE